MTALKVIGIILLIFILIGFLRVGALMQFGDELRVQLSVGPFRFTLLPAKEKKETPKKKAKEKKPKSEGEEAKQKKKPSLPKPTKRSSGTSSRRRSRRSRRQRNAPASAFASTRWKFSSSLAARTPRISRRPTAMRAPRCGV